MQACEVCGWDTRAGTRVCASCRAELESSESVGDGVLAGVLQQARDMSADAGDAGQPPQDRVGATTSRRPRGPRRDDEGREQVVLREIEPGDEVERPHRSEPSSVAASLLEAFQPRQNAVTARVEPSTAPDGLRVGGPVEDVSSTDAADDALLDPTDHTPTVDPAPSMADTDRLAAVAPAPIDEDERRLVEPTSRETEQATGAPVATSADAQARADEPTRPSASPDDSGPITDRFANIPTVPMDPGPSPELSTDAPAAPERGADATSAPPTGDNRSKPAQVRADGRPGPQGAATSTSSEGGQEVPAWRAALREAGTWTAVAQFTLLFIGMLCVFQVVVLLVVNQFLSQAQSEAAVAADMLAAHAKVATVMLPALVGGAFAAAALAGWRAYVDPQEPDDNAPLRRWVLGLPVAIWGVIVTASFLLVVVLLGTSATVVEAQRMTMWAIGACTLLGIACVAAPRGLAVAEDIEDVEARPPRADTIAR